MKDKTFSCLDITEETETMCRMIALEPYDVRISRHQATAAATYYLWLRLAAGFQQMGDTGDRLSLSPGIKPPRAIRPHSAT